MSSPKDKEVLYDIRPVNSSGQVDFAKISQIEAELDLSHASVAEVAAYKEEISKVFQEELGKDHDIVAALADVGATLHLAEAVSEESKKEVVLATVPPKPAPMEVEPPPVPMELPPVIVERPAPMRVSPAPGPSLPPLHPDEWHSPAAREIDKFMGRSFDGGGPVNPVAEASSAPESGSSRHLLTKILWLGVAVLLLFSAVRLVDWGKKFKQGFLDTGEEAADNLQKAKDDIVNFDFASAANNFTLAYDNFSGASSRLDSLGTSLVSFLSEAPGFGQVKAAKNILKAGENISKAGQNLATALDGFYRTNFISYFGFEFLKGESQPVSISYFVKGFRDAALFAQKRLAASGELLAQIADDSLPEEKRAEFLDIKAQIPVLEEYLGRAVDYSGFLLGALGQSGPKKYILLFQNNTELRPSGGFPGSYALIGFNRGFLRDFKVDDIYNVDGQAQKKYVPPVELQHITSTWGMRDASWFVNFPDSARKVIQMYKNDGGPQVDGVLTITPTVIGKILEVIGPIELPEYKLTLDHNNFLAEIQEEIEYGDNRVQPKTILVDFTPKFIEKLGQQDKDQWFKIVKILLEATEQKHILAYFSDPELQKVAEDNDLAGIVKSTTEDYLFITHSNVKGIKTDAVIENSYDLKSSLTGDGFIEHTLTINRAHRGGKSDYGFYNRQNFDYLRVLVPKGSILSSIQGQTSGNFTPLIRNYSTGDYVEDAELKKYDSEVSVVTGGVKQFTEADKTVFGFWHSLQPGQTKAITLKYKTPVRLDDNEYLLLVQKQPGTLEDRLTFSFDIPSKKEAIFRYPELTLDDNRLTGETKLVKDLIFGIKLQ
ncbi:MAG: DUF4012 domain-containing protein [bacterium]|nr:DUF4012 domain-containing protein [bacterium]